MYTYTYMQVTIHIRKANIEAWNAIPRNERSALVNELLEGLPKKPKPAIKEPVVQNWGNLDEFAKQKGLDEATKHQSIEQQLEALGLKYDKYRPNEAFNPDIEDYVPYQTKNGEVILD